ncbi:MAG: hypothetical protein GY832_22055 [Chloroflexi bacterium]|nr:hypothetical protein [Chloroflexota bacterium]
MPGVSEEVFNERTEHLLDGQKALRQDVQALATVIRGNGSPGLVARVAAVERANERAWQTGLRILPWVIGVAGAAYGLGVSL